MRLHMPNVLNASKKHLKWIEIFYVCICYNASHYCFKCNQTILKVLKTFIIIITEVM